MSRVTQVAIAGVILLGVAGCSAEADSATAPSPVAASPSPMVSISRQDVRVRVDPTKITGGATTTIHITAGCPLPQGGPEYRATARSDAFTGLVTLVPPQAIPAPSAAVPELRGGATIRADAKPGGYRVQVRCEATNDVGSASFRIEAPRATHTRIPTRAPHAGGGGTAAGGPTDEPGLPTGVTVLVLLAALGIGIGVARRRSGA
jgi:hypothetical protein